jgi:hypothetical protein
VGRQGLLCDVSHWPVGLEAVSRKIDSQQEAAALQKCCRLASYFEGHQTAFSWVAGREKVNLLDLTNSLLIKLSKAMLGIYTGRVKRNLLAINEER